MHKLLIFWLLLLAQRLQADASWWSSVAQLSTSLAGQSISRTGVCDHIKGLSPGQSAICDTFKDHMPAIGAGAHRAIQECQQQFRSHRWNCSTPYGSGYVGPVHKLGTKEAAYTYAILSAGVAHEVARRCRNGQLSSCGCAQEEPSKKWKWGGCGDNIAYGYRFSRDFIDVRENEKDPKRDHDHGRSLMNKHNNEVGRKILRKHMTEKCKCHGVSGSCNLKTCWMQLPPMRNVSEILNERYDNAVRVKLNNRGNLQVESHQNEESKWQRAAKRRTRGLKMDLLYMDDSPDYCRMDRSTGTLGTEGRICNRSSSGADGCDSLCCGRGYNTYTIEEKSKCNCKFEWCCKVVCQICSATKQVDICK